MKNNQCEKCGFNLGEGKCTACGKTGVMDCWMFTKPSGVRRMNFEKQTLAPKIQKLQREGIWDWSKAYSFHTKLYPHLFGNG